MLHSLLQLREIELISQLEEISNQNLEKLEYMHHTISQHHKELSSVLQDAEQAMENSLISMNIVDVVKKLLSVKELPCYLVPVTTEQTDEVKIHFNPDFQDMIKSYGKIEAFITPKYTLRNESEIPPGFEDDIIEEIPTDTESVTSRSESFSEDIPDISVLSQKPNSSKTIKEDNVFVTHIQNPSNFWVQKLNDSRKMKGLTDSINKWCYSSESSKCIPLSLKIGKLCFLF
ncbi:uncharacterized protein LOC111641313 [Centruroides sculpturatus]|uniref:uncharacterized protein LOC111641313 n=1 Tax=Centruroides sculpturatus TaxID=218467 RepID=UPI000C6CA46D|nr:uncharacterized protein LOC111641313 [Centruroides sculpturatus]